jgi:hypothetical protein
MFYRYIYATPLAKWEYGHNSIFPGEIAFSGSTFGRFVRLGEGLLDTNFVHGSLGPIPVLAWSNSTSNRCSLILFAGAHQNDG